MTETRIDYELPFKSVNTEGLCVGVADELSGISSDDIGLVHGNGHPDAISDQHLIGLVFPVEPSAVTQANVDAVTADIESLIGTAVYERGWGSHEPDYLDQ